MLKRFYTAIEAPFGHLYITAENDTVTRIGIDKPKISDAYRCDSIPFLQETAKHLQAYLNGETQTVTLQSKPLLSPFQSAIFREVCRLSYGSSTDLETFAASIGKQKSARGIATVCLSNPLWIVIPTHRIRLLPTCSSHDKPLCAAEYLRRMEERFTAP